TTDGHDPRECPSCKKGQLGLKIGRFGPYIACSAYPECNYKAQLGDLGGSGASEAEGGEVKLPKTLGKDPANGEDVSMRKGPYGVYVQLGESKTPKRASLFKSMRPETMTLEVALQLLSLPRELGPHPDTGKPIVVNNGKFGPYLLHEGKFTTLPAAEDPLTIGINRAVDVLSRAPVKGGGPEVIRSLGKHPEDSEEVTILKGRYGPYIKHGKVNAPFPKEANIDTLTLQEAIPLLAARANAGPSKKFGKKAPVKKAAAPKKEAAPKAAKEKAPAKAPAKPKAAAKAKAPAKAKAKKAG
ncbi:MAG: topoisomerase DNA-binding C4 zinc finger domain-containing protein, partial [Rickettsiales bacterium]|nr:topoisomerase DNA-binding C4 zinc finger domain-containing protein [Rickettsiales bacterium]